MEASPASEQGSPEREAREPAFDSDSAPTWRYDKLTRATLPPAPLPPPRLLSPFPGHSAQGSSSWGSSSPGPSAQGSFLRGAIDPGPSSWGSGTKLSAPDEIWQRRWQELAQRYGAARDALQRTFQVIERRDQAIAALERRLRDYEADRQRLLEQLRRAQMRQTETDRSSQRLFQAFCSSLPGRCLGGRFEVLHRIGEGGYGVVYQAVDRRTHRDVALKLLRIPEGQGEDGKSSGGSGDPHLSQLAHPNITTVFETGATGEGIPFVAMELLRGKNLAEVLARGEPLTVGQAACIAREVCLALAEAHRWDVVHRDIKPSNVFLARHRRGVIVKVLDFGLARVVRAPEVDGEAVAGTPAYVAPERLQREPYDFRADIYAVGLLLYDMLGCGLGSLCSDGWSARWSVAPPALHELRGDVPVRLSEFAARCVRRNPAVRPTAQELAAQLAPHADPVDSLLPLLTGPSRPPSPRDDLTLESIDRQRFGESDTVPLLPLAGPAFAISARTTTPAAASPKAPVTKDAVPSMRARRSQSWRPFLPPGQTQRKPTPSS